MPFFINFLLSLLLLLFGILIHLTSGPHPPPPLNRKKNKNRGSWNWRDQRGQAGPSCSSPVRGLQRQGHCSDINTYSVKAVHECVFERERAGGLGVLGGGGYGLDGTEYIPMAK